MTENIKVIKSNRKTLALEINKNLEIIVRAPKRASQKEIEAFIDLHKDWLEKSYSKMSERVSNLPEYPSDEKSVRELKAQAERVICPKIDYYSEILGVQPAGVSFNRAKTRFGSCSAKNTLNFSCYLMLYDEKAIDYVVLHELCHIKQKNHSKAFYDLVAEVMPDYKERVKMLKGEI